MATIIKRIIFHKQLKTMTFPTKTAVNSLLKIHQNCRYIYLQEHSEEKMTKWMKSTSSVFHHSMSKDTGAIWFYWFIIVTTLICNYVHLNECTLKWKSMILLVDLDLQKIHLHRFMYTIWKKFIIMIIIIRFGIDPGIYNTSIAATSNNLIMIVWLMNTRSLILEQGGV